MLSRHQQSSAFSALTLITLLAFVPIVVGQEPAPAEPIPEILLPPAPLPPAPIPEITTQKSIERTESRSGQFTIYGADLQTRGALAVLFEDQRDGFLKATHAKPGDKWKSTIVVQLHGFETPVDKKKPSPQKKAIFEPLIVGDGWRLQLHLHLGDGVDIKLIENEITRLLLLERGLRAVAPDSVEDQLKLPAWLVSGMQEATAWKNGKGNRKLYESVLKSGAVQSLEDLLKTEDPTELDPASKTSFEVSSGALTIAMLEQNKGQQANFDTFLSESITYAGDMKSLLGKHFPQMNLSTNSLQKWWQLQMADLSNPLVIDTMSVQETDERLTQILVAFMRSETGDIQELPITEWEFILKQDPKKTSLPQISAAITQLSYRCFPLHRPILQGYQDIIRDLAKGETTKIDTQLLDLAKAREQLKKDALRTRDYLDWYELNNGLTRGETFDDFLKLKEELRQTSEGKDDHISKYLDDMQKVFDTESP